MEFPQRIILEITNLCNLDCAFCLRNAWDGGLGRMSAEIFERFLGEIRKSAKPPAVIFGGYGEPLSHPSLLDYIQACKKTGADTTLITNGTLLSPGMMEDLVWGGLDRLWISFDNAHQESILSGPGQLAHSSLLQNLAAALGPITTWKEKLDLGLAFVLTRHNDPELLELIEQGRKFGFERFFITNLEAYDSALAAQTPYQLEQFRSPGAWQASQAALVDRLEKITRHNGTHIEGPLLHPNQRCPFADRGDLVIRWDGELSPCLPLLYGRTIHLGSWRHEQQPFSLGNLQRRSIREAWTDPQAVSLRARLLEKDYSPCLHCRDCWLADDNLRDCMGYEHPACGGCLWAEGLIGCP